MYRYVETEKYEGKTLRTGGVTRRSLNALKHLPKVGKVRYVRGYVYRGRNGTQHVGVLVRGDQGSVRFGGFSWGYRGEGPRGLDRLFDALGLPEWPRKTVHSIESPDYSASSIGEYWRIEFGDELSVVIPPSPHAKAA